MSTTMPTQWPRIWNLLRRSLTACALLLGATVPAQAQTQVTTYQPSFDDFRNPERGFHFNIEYVPEFGETEYVTESLIGFHNPEHRSVVRMIYTLSEYRNRVLDSAILNRIKSDLLAFRAARLKVYLLFDYNFGPIGASDAPKARVLQHIAQLQPVLQANGDIIAFLVAGFIGTWGEWHDSTNGLDNDNDRRDILFRLLQALPKERMVAVRTPSYKQGIFGTNAPLTSAEAFKGSNRARTGATNECFLASFDDLGTYAGGVNDPTLIEKQKNYLNRDNRYLIQYGSTCSVAPEAQPYIHCANALKDLARMRYSVLDGTYLIDVLNVWKREGCYDQVSKRLGYRFRLTRSEIPRQANPGAPFAMSFTIVNDGFASPYNPRKIEIVLREKTKKTLYRLAVKDDPRFWLAGEMHQVRVNAVLPATMRAGLYDVFVNFADPAPRLTKLPEYAIRLANTGVWEPATGYNSLFRSVAVTANP
jgi:Domain of unknown function (DUF4832)/Domain of unknown function (DUF4874)